MGDDLINEATYQFFDDHKVKYRPFSFKHTPADDFIVISGGGSLGTKYKSNRDQRQAVYDYADQNNIPVIVLPQSYTDTNEEYFPPTTTLYLREQKSYDASAHAHKSLLPDMALYFKPSIPYPPAIKDVGIFLRKDVEGTKLNLKSSGDPAEMTDNINGYFALVAKHHTIITNRLHFAIIGLILGRKVILADNNYGKNRAVYEAWLKKLGCMWLEA